jgi:hypothetical protein
MSVHVLSLLVNTRHDFATWLHRYIHFELKWIILLKSGGLLGVSNLAILPVYALYSYGTEPGVVWLVWPGVVWCGMAVMAWCGLVWSGMALSGIVRHGLV